MGALAARNWRVSDRMNVADVNANGSLRQSSWMDGRTCFSLFGVINLPLNYLLAWITKSVGTIKSMDVVYLKADGFQNLQKMTALLLRHCMVKQSGWCF